MDRKNRKQGIAFRFSPGTVARLRRRAVETRASQTALAERYVDEGLRQDEHPMIYFRDGGARRPAVVGSRLAVADIIATIRQNSNSVTAAAEYLESPVERVDAALRYYADYKEEVDEWAERCAAAAELEGERRRRRREALA
jgi:uncharacterized protein (DUF433 family)